MSDQHDVRTTCPRDCYDACGALVRVKDGRVVHVRGDPDHPVSRGKLCRKCTLAYNGVFLDPTARLTDPLVRRGPKGGGRFDAVSWEEALELVASRLGAIAAEDGARIIYSHYTGSFALLSYFFPMRLMRRLGGTEVAPDTICNDAGHTALSYVYGTSLVGFDPRTVAQSRCILVWGANPSASAPHQHEDWLPSAPGSVVVVDPVRTPTAEQADLHLQPFPGSDAALAFGLLHVLARDGLVDHEFLAGHAIGGAELLARAEPCDPSWTMAQTGVPADAVEQAAHLYGAGPSLLWIGQGLQRQPGGGNVVRSVAALPAVTGNLGRVGAGFLYLNGFGSRGIDEDYLSAAAAYPEVPEPISHMALATTLEDAERAQAFVCWNVNPMASCPEQGRLRRALEREDLFTVVTDLFATDTADLADVVLPAASWLECDDIVVPYFHRALAAQVKATEPLGRALPNSEIFRRLAAALGSSDPPLLEPDDEVIARVLEGTGTGLDFEELARCGTVWTPADTPAVQFGDGHYPTASGRIELASEAAEADGHGSLPRPAADERPGAGRLRLLSPASPWALNTSFSNDERVVRRSGALTLSLTAADAAALELSDGALARVTSSAGSLVVPVAITDALPVGVGLIPKGGWPKLRADRSNVNALTVAQPSDMGASTTVHGLEVVVTPVDARGP
ncbi:MAG TPA: molybdopterin-dependent oxidoreductase [Solirubrobacteraceae bacterium]|nr:molybdopterin-dependent oxidoreductase [Solirubrobacteraceae bacterium]